MIVFLREKEQKKKKREKQLIDDRLTYYDIKEDLI